MKMYAEKLGLSHPKRIVATGGASSNHHILQVLANVWQTPVFVQEKVDSSTGISLGAMSDSAALGAAYRALWAVRGRKPIVHHPTKSSSSSSSSSLSSSAASSTDSSFFIREKLVASPVKETAQVYSEFAKRLQFIHQDALRRAAQ
jgi:sugar (pentulose or hexulose) kinase